MIKMNLFDKSLEEIEEDQRNATILLEARKTIEKLATSIHAFGGEMDPSFLSLTTLADLAVCAAQNKFRIELRPAK